MKKSLFPGIRRFLNGVNNEKRTRTRSDNPRRWICRCIGFSLVSMLVSGSHLHIKLARAVLRRTCEKNADGEDDQ